MDQANPDERRRAPNGAVSRRSLFRRAVLSGLERVEQAGQQLGKELQAQLGSERDRPRRFLRPPGARTQVQFEEACSRCGMCVAVCPARCIMLSPGDDASGQQAVAGGLPYIVARDSPCVVCDELSCMSACPTGALTPVADAEQIRMGVARVDVHRCLRTAPLDRGQPVSVGGPPAGGEDCRICVTQCPLGDKAIGVSDTGLIEVRNGCIGCGICEWACPTEPTSVWVAPAEAHSATDEHTNPYV